MSFLYESTADRADLEIELFARIVPVIDSTRLRYEGQHDDTDEQREWKFEAAEILSALGSIKLMWPLPQEMIDGTTLEQVKVLFQDFSSFQWYQKPRRIVSIQKYHRVFDAIFDIANM